MHKIIYTMPNNNNNAHYLFPNKGGMNSVDWTYSMPSKITGLRGSCLVIPCSFDIRKENLKNIDVKWYLYSSTEYPLVYDSNNMNVLNKYFDKTRLYGLPSEKNCSLEIKQLDMHHNGDRLYPWMDPKPVQTFHKEENSFDNSIELKIKGSPKYRHFKYSKKVFDVNFSVLLDF